MAAGGAGADRELSALQASALRWLSVGAFINANTWVRKGAGARRAVIIDAQSYKTD
jgi:hypothetical protein